MCTWISTRKLFYKEPCGRQLQQGRLSGDQHGCEHKYFGQDFIFTIYFQKLKQEYSMRFGLDILSEGKDQNLSLKYIVLIETVQVKKIVFLLTERIFKFAG